DRNKQNSGFQHGRGGWATSIHIHILEIGLLLGHLLYFFTRLDLVDEDLGWLEAWDKMLVDNERCVSGSISGYFLLALLVDKTPKPANVDIMPICHRRLNHTKARFNRRRHIGLVNTGFLRNLVNYICLGHFR